MNLAHSPEYWAMLFCCKTTHSMIALSFLKACLFPSDISFTMKVIQSYDMLNPVLSSLRKTNSIKNYSAFLHEQITCMKKMHTNNHLLNIKMLKTWENLLNNTVVTKSLPEMVLNQSVHQNFKKLRFLGSTPDLLKRKFHFFSPLFYPIDLCTSIDLLHLLSHISLHT